MNIVTIPGAQLAHMGGRGRLRSSLNEPHGPVCTRQFITGSGLVSCVLTRGRRRQGSADANERLAAGDGRRTLHAIGVPPTGEPL